MPVHTLATRLQSLRQGWVLFVTLFGLGLLRRWILKKHALDDQQRRSRDRPGASAHRRGGGFAGSRGGGFSASQNNRSGSLHSGRQAPSSLRCGSSHDGQLDLEMSRQQLQQQQPRKKKQQASSSRSDARNPSSPEVQPAEEHELGEAWHFGGLRHWLWLHDGSRVNGWLEFGHDGVLRTSLTRDERGSWKRGDDGEIVATFGKCHHVLELLPAAEDGPPSFVVSQRTMRDGSPLKKKSVRTLGRLDTRRNS